MQTTGCTWHACGEDPGEGNGVALELEGEEVLSVGLKEASVALSELDPGVYDFGVRVKDANGEWSNAVIRRIDYQSNDFELAGVTPITKAGYLVFVHKFTYAEVGSLIWMFGFDS